MQKKSGGKIMNGGLKMTIKEMLKIYDKIKNQNLERNNYPNVKIREFLHDNGSGSIIILDENDKTYCRLSSLKLPSNILIEDEMPKSLADYNLASFR